MEGTVLLVSVREAGESDRKAFLREAEMRSLLSTLGLQVVYALSFTVKEKTNRFYLGKGQADSVREAVLAYSPDEVAIDASISPRQESNLEKLFEVPVSDREAIILSIFFQNARSREARLQIEKAEAEYLRPRLADREANLSQQRGGVRGAKGEGERKIELQRRRIDERIRALDSAIRESAEVRNVQRQSRLKAGLFSFALLGYTNAGKSTILNTLTKAGVLAEDKLFATLDTVTRSMRLPNGQKVLLSDTVGFISELPAGLVKAFSSTLEEALSADALIIVADASHPDAVGCFRNTVETLESLHALDKARILAINKTDSIYDDISYSYLKSQPLIIAETSMKEGIGIDSLIDAMCRVTDEAFEDIEITEGASSDIISRLSADASIRSIEYSDASVTVKARIRRELAAKYTGKAMQKETGWIPG